MPRSRSTPSIPDGTPLHLRCEVLYSSGHVEQIELHLNKTPYLGNYLGRIIAKEAGKYVSLDPETFSKPFFTLSCQRVMDDGSAVPTPHRTWEMVVLDDLASRQELDLWLYKRSMGDGLAAFLLPQLLLALGKLGRVELVYDPHRQFNNTVRWLG